MVSTVYEMIFLFILGRSNVIDYKVSAKINIRLYLLRRMEQLKNTALKLKIKEAFYHHLPRG